MDFLQAGNAFEIVGTLEEIYVREGDGQKSSERLESEDRVVGGREVLRLAESQGKGWFALLLSERLDVLTVVPEYILRAVAFACHLTIPSASRRIAEYRVTEAVAGGDWKATMLGPLTDLRQLGPAEFVAAYRKQAPKDDFSRFCQFIDEYRQS